MDVNLLIDPLLPNIGGPNDRAKAKPCQQLLPVGRA
jgi:hypothetical protein